MVSNSIDILIESLRDSHLLRADQFSQIFNPFFPKFEGPDELADQIVKMGWITQFQAKKLVSGQGEELKLGNYVLIDEIGEGGMGKVYKGRQTRLNRLVALKVVRPSLLVNDTSLKRFQREAKAAAQLAHPNIVRLFDADQVGDRHFLAMEYVEGKDLSKLVHEGGPLPVTMACSFIRQAATGLQHAHDQGLIHRDIKPSNLLVTCQGKSSKPESVGVIKILDMGLARLAHDDSDTSDLTRDGAVIGTPDFMAPEQAKNSSLADARSDLYSLGCTLYYLLSGQSPFPKGTTLEKLLQHQMDPPIQIQLKRQDVPNEVAAILHRLLSKKPYDRYESGTELANALAGWSVFDPKNERLLAPGVKQEPSPAEADLPATAHIINPFEFDDSVPETAPEPPPSHPTEPPFLTQVTPLPAPPKELEENPPEPPRRRRRIWWAVGIGTTFLLAVVGFFVYRSLTKEPPPQQRSAPDDAKPNPAPKLADPAAIDFYLPADTGLVAVLDLQQLSKSKYFQDSILRKFDTELRTFKMNAGFDPLKSVERVIVAVPSGNPAQAVIIIQGNAVIASPNFLAWIGRQTGVTSTSERFPDGVREVYFVPGQKDKTTGKSIDYYGAVLGLNPCSVVLSRSRERVLEAIARIGNKTEVKFDDALLRPALAKYPPPYPAALWACAGGESKLFTSSDKKDKKEMAATPKDTGLAGLTGVVRLSDSLSCDIEFEAKNQQLANAARTRLAGFFRSGALMGNNIRSFRLAELIQNAVYAPSTDAKGENFNLFQWSNTVFSEKVHDFFAPFLAAQ